MPNKWMTREEFESKNDSTYCWVGHIDGNVYQCFLSHGRYYDIDYRDVFYRDQEIKAVMPIEKPEYPKEVG